MKKALLFLTLAIAIESSSQDNKFPNPYQFILIDTSITATKTELYTRARAWFAQEFRSGKDVLQMDDKEAGKLIGRALFAVPVNNGFGMPIGESYVYYTITIDVRDNKFRCILSDFLHEKGVIQGTGSGGNLVNDKPDCGNLYIPKKLWNKYREIGVTRAQEVLASFKKAMDTEAKKDEF